MKEDSHKTGFVVSWCRLYTVYKVKQCFNNKYRYKYNRRYNKYNAPKQVYYTLNRINDVISYAGFCLPLKRLNHYVLVFLTKGYTIKLGTIDKQIAGFSHNRAYKEVFTISYFDAHPHFFITIVFEKHLI